jgi:hypothetical protein
MNGIAYNITVLYPISYLFSYFLYFCYIPMSLFTKKILIANVVTKRTIINKHF